MAGERREGQGLQIAVIIFAMLTIILAVTTYIFYAQGQTAMKEKDEAQARAGQKQIEVDKAMYKILAMQQVLGLRGVGDPEVQAQKGKPGVGEDVEVTELLNNFKADMALVADQVAATEKRDYRTVNNILVAALNRKNASVTDANIQTRDMQARTTATAAAEAGRTKTAEDNAATANTDKDKAIADFAAARKAMDDDKNKLAQDVANISKKAKEDADKAGKIITDASTLETTLRGTIASFRVRVEELQKTQVDLFENPDGKIIQVSQSQRLVWINVGRADGLMRQTTFSVYDHKENGVASAKAKARIEVVEVRDEHLAEARILEDSAANPIMKGDIIHTPSWSPGQRIHFAMAGKMDINRDGVDDYEMVKNVIILNGGIIDAELKPSGERVPPGGGLSVNTRYLVLGDPPDETAAENKKLLEEYTKILGEIAGYGIDKMPAQKLLEMMGWKSEERTVELAGSRGGGEFRKRTPGKTAAPGATPAPAGTPAPGTTPAPATTPMPGAPADPFAVPAATPAPAGGAPADPFAPPAAPMGKAPAAPAPADPFATPAPKAP